MTQVTVRNIDEEWVAKAKAEAKDKGISMNAVLKEAIGRGLGVAKSRETNGLEKFAGCMPFESEEERKQWDENMKVFDRIDEELWK